MTTIEQLLNDFATGHAAHDLTITYSDMHGLWGGVTITLAASGTYERLERQRGMVEPNTLRKTVTFAQIQAVIQLLRETRAWEQRTPARAPVPDEVRATLTLRAGAVETSIWERYNDLAQNARLVRVRDLLLELAQA